MSSAEFSRWLGIFETYGWGFELANWRMGVICQTVANFSGNVPKNKPTKPTDFYPGAR